MTLRRTAPLVLALLACQADLDRRPLSTIDYAVFDPSSSRIPLPNDLALQSAATMPAGAQKELLGQFIAAGGFPNDQEMPITIQLTRATVDAGAGGAITYEAPDLDLASVTAETVALVEVSATGAVPVPFEASYAKNADGQRGTLTLRRPVTNGTRRWTAGAQVVVALRGGADGVKFVGSADGIQPQPTFYVVREAALGNKDLTQRENQALLPGTKEQKAAAGAQLDALRKAYLQPLQLVDQVGGVPAEDVAVLATFKIAPSAGVAVAVDAGSGIVPLPIDLLRNPDANGKPGTVVNNAAFGPAAAGLATLDGFSTTATILAQTTGVIDADTVTGETVKLFKLDGEGGATLVPTVSATEPSPRYVTQPPVLNQACPVGSCSTVIGLQPAVPVPVGAGVLALPPLEEGTDYAVVITKGVLDATQKPLVKSTFAKILLDVQAPVVVDGKSMLSGVADDTAKQIAMIKAKLAPALEQVTAADVVMAYTFRTQSITGTALQLSAAVYEPTRAAFFTATEPVDEPLVALTGMPIPAGVQAIWRTTVPTLDAINPANGALQPDTTQWDVAGIPALVAVPEAKPEFPSCPAPADALKCLPLVIVHHGLGGNRLTGAHLAAQLANAGFVVAAIDAPYHGSRAFCHADTDCMTDDGETGVCTVSAAHAPQGDDMGVCTVGSPRLFPIPDGNGGFLPTPSGNHFISANFFRIRDAVRQDLIDHSALVLALSRPPAPFPQPAAEPFKTALAQKGIALNGQVRYLGVSLGGIIGSSIVATNPRIDRAVLNVAGGTLVDVFTNAPAFASDVDDLFLSLGIDRHDPAHAAKYLQTLNVAKWILDPADPLNFAPHLQGETLPNLLTGQAMSAKSVLGQAAKGDQVVPNPFNFLLYGIAGIHTTLYVDATTTNNVVSHSFIGASPEPMQQVVEYLLDPTADQPSTITLNAPPPAP